MVDTILYGVSNRIEMQLVNIVRGMGEWLQPINYLQTR